METASHKITEVSHVLPTCSALIEHFGHCQVHSANPVLDQHPIEHRQPKQTKQLTKLNTNPPPPVSE